MKIQEHRPEVLRALRAIKSAAEYVSTANPGKRYNIAFGLALAEPMIDLSESEVSSFIEVVTRVVNQFSSSAKISLDLNIQEYSDVEQTLLQKTRENFQESLKLEGKLKPVAVEAPESATGSQG